MILLDTLPTMADYLKPDNVIAIFAATITALSATLMYFTFKLQATTVHMQQKILDADRKLKAKELKPILKFEEYRDDYESGEFHVFIDVGENVTKIVDVFIKGDYDDIKAIYRSKDTANNQYLLPGRHLLFRYLVTSKINVEYLDYDVDLITFCVLYEDAIGNPYNIEARNSTLTRKYTVKEKSIN